MDCRQMRDLFHPYIDGELDLVASLEIERHLQSCAACSQAHASQQELRTSIRAGRLYYDAPVDLRKQIHSAIRQAAPTAFGPRAVPWRWMGVAASLAVIVGSAWLFSPSGVGSFGSDRVDADLVGAHVRSLMATHLTDVGSSDQHTVKPWFAGKLDFSPPVKDLAEHGFLLVGGRLDYAGNRPVAALVYRRRQHVINVFIWPSAGTPAKTRLVDRQGYHLLSGSDAGMAYGVVSDLNVDELREFARLLQSPPPSTHAR